MQQRRQRAVAGREHVRRDQRHGAEPDAADRRLQPSRDAAAAERVLGQRHAAHDGDTKPCAGQGEQQQQGDAAAGQRRRRGDVADKGLAHADRAGHQHAGDRRRHHGREAKRRVAADDDLEAVEGAGQRGAERGGDGAGGARADHHAKVGTAQVEGAAERGGETRPKLGVAGLEPDRGAEAVGAQRLRADDEGVDHRHAAAGERVGLDRVDRAATTAAQQQPVAGAEQQTAADRQQRKPGVEQPLRGAQRGMAVEPLVQERRKPRQARGGEAGDNADHHGKRDEADLAGAHTVAQAGA